MHFGTLVRQQHEIASVGLNELSKSHWALKGGLDYKHKRRQPMPHHAHLFLHEMKLHGNSGTQQGSSMGDDLRRNNNTGIVVVSQVKDFQGLATTSALSFAHRPN